MGNERQRVDLRQLNARGHVLNLQGKKFTTYAGLLELSHEAGLQAIDSQMHTYEHEAGVAIFKTTVTGDRGTYTGWGDATRADAKRGMAAAFLRMAETRSIARALRLYLGCGMTAHEELPGEMQRAPRQGDREHRGQPAPQVPSQPMKRIGAPPARKEAPKARQAPKVLAPKAHPSWGQGVTHFKGALKEIGLDYPQVAAYCRKNGWPVPATWVEAERQRFLDKLTNEGMEGLYQPAQDAEEIPAAS